MPQGHPTDACSLVVQSSDVDSRLRDQGRGNFFEFAEKALKKWEADHNAHFEEFFKATGGGGKRES